MTDSTSTEAAEVVTETATDSTATDSTTTETKVAEAENTKGEEALGDAGKKALDRMKAERQTAIADAREAKAALAAIQAKLDGKEAEHKAQTEAQRIQDEALGKANERILKAEVRANAASKLADPADALRFIDLSEFEVGSDGEVDSSAIAQAIDDLITSKPYLAAQSGGRFQGSADAGARNDASKVAQLTRADMGSMTPEAIEAARVAGQFDTLLGIS